jgi:hypothetical protein
MGWVSGPATGQTRRFPTGAAPLLVVSPRARGLAYTPPRAPHTGGAAPIGPFGLSRLAGHSLIQPMGASTAAAARRTLSASAWKQHGPLLPPVHG